MPCHDILALFKYNILLRSLMLALGSKHERCLCVQCTVHLLWIYAIAYCQWQVIKCFTL